MAQLDEYWNQIKQSESFQNLKDGEKEKVRQHLFDSYIQTSDSYLNLPQSQRISVKQHFDDLTKIEREGTMQGLVRKGKEVIGEVGAMAKDVKRGANLIVPAAQVGLEKAGQITTGMEAGLDVLQPAPMKAGYKALGAVAEGISKGGKAVGEAIEPTDAEMQGHSAMEATLPERMPKMLTHFDHARLYASGAVQTAADMAAGMLPNDYFQTTGFMLLDHLNAVEGKAYMGKGHVEPPGAPPEPGGIFERMITRQNVEANARTMRDGPPRPLEQLAKKEAEVKAQGDVDQYQAWLEEHDKLSANGGEPVGDLHPDLKVNVSQLRDAAAERLQKIKDEPIRLESLGRAEDELHGYFRTRIEMHPKPGEVIPLPATSEPLPRTEMLPEGPRPAGLLEGPAKPAAAAPVVKSPPPIVKSAAPGAPTGAQLGEVGLKGYKDFLSKSFAKRLPNETKQAVDRLSGALLSALKGDWIHPTNPSPLTPEMGTMLDRLVEDATQIHLEEAGKKPAAVGPSDVARLQEKGLSVEEVKAEARRLQGQHEGQRQNPIGDAIKDLGGVRGYKEVGGHVPEAEEFRDVPAYLRGTHTMDEMADMLVKQGLLPEGSGANELRVKIKEMSGRGEKRSVKSFFYEAERNLEHELKVQAGFEEPGQSQIPDMPAASMPEGTIKQPTGQVPDEALLEGLQNPDNSQRSIYDLMSEIGDEVVNKLKGEGGGFNTEEFDPVRQARMEANIKELVDRARILGYTTTQDILVYAAKNAPLEIQREIQKSLAKTLSPFDTHAYQELDAAGAGNEIAKKGLMDRAMREYLKEVPSRMKGTWKRLKANSQLLQFKDADESLMTLKNNLLVHDSFRKHSRLELAAQRWYNEGKAPSLESLSTIVPEAEAKEMLRLYREPTENMKRAKSLTQSHEDEMHNLFSEYYDQLGYVENHVTRRWQRPEEYLNWEGQRLQARPNFSKGRKLLTQADGIEAGYVPKTLDIKDDLKASNDYRVHILSRLHMLSKIAATFDKTGRGSIIDEAGASLLTPHKGKAPAAWLRYPDSLLKGLAINPDYKLAIDFMRSTKMKGWGAETMDWLAATSKASTLGLSGFHPLSLSEMLLTGVSYRDVFTFNSDRNVLWKTLKTIAKGATEGLENPLEWGNPLSSDGRAKNAENFSALYDSYMKGSAVLANRPLALDMAERGFKFTSLDDDAFNILNKHIRSYESWLDNRVTNSPDPKVAAYYKDAKSDAEGVRQTYEVFDKTLWAYLKDSFSMSIYENQLADNIRKFNLEAPEGQKMPVPQIKMQTADFVNKEMGGISMAKLLITPRTQQVLQWALLAPSWTIGRALMGSTLLSGGPQGRQARKQALRMAVGYYIMGNLANYAQTKKYLGQGRYLWDNPEDQKLNIFWKLNDKKEELYLQASKASTEIVDDLVHPLRTAAYKTSKPVQAAIKVFNYATFRNYYPGASPESPGKAAVNMFIPSIASGQSAYGSLPVKRGVTPAKIAGLLDQYHATGNQKYLDDAMRFGVEAGIDVRALERSARSRHRADVRRDIREDIKKRTQPRWSDNLFR